MKILFDKETKTITIKDNIKWNNIIIFIAAIAVLSNAVVQLIRHPSETPVFLICLWILLIGVFIYRLVFIVFKTTYQSQMKAEEIEYVRFKKTFNYRTLYFSLRNGKRRELALGLSPNDYATMVEHCKNFGIEIRLNQNEPSNS